jgi:hypothetical protein
MRAVGLDAQFRGVLGKVPQTGGVFDPAAWDALTDAQKQPLAAQLEIIAGSVAEMIGPDGPADGNHLMHRAYASNTSIWLLFGAAVASTIIMLATIASFWPRATATAACLKPSATNATQNATQPLAATLAAASNPPAQQGGSTAPGSASSQLAGPCEGDLLRMIIYMGALGGLLHLTGSLAKYVGNRQLLRSWIIYYWLMPLEGAALAPIVYLLLRVSVLGMPASGTAGAASLNHMGLYAFAGLTGLFSKQALEMLGEVFSVIFKRVGGKNPLENGSGAKPPAGK